MRSDPLVTIIVPTYGRPQFLNEAIQSLIDQSYRNLQIVVVDDCSPAPVELASEDKRIRVIRHRHNSGPAAARNTGLAEAKGDFVTFLDDDDLFVFDRVERGVCEIGAARMHVVPSNANLRRYEGDMRLTLQHSDPPSILQVMARTEDVCSFDPSLRVSEDIDWWLRMAPHAVFHWSDSPGLWVRRHDTIRPGVDAEVRLMCRIRVATRHAEALDARGRAHQFSRVSASAVHAQRRALSAKFAVRSLAAHPTKVAAKLLIRSMTPGARWSRT